MRLGRCTGTTLNTAIQGKIDAFKLNGQVNSYYNYRSTLKSIERFAGGSVPFSAVSADWLSRLDKFLRNEGKTVTTINFYMKALKCVVNDARRNGILKEAQYPFGRGKYEIPSGNSRKLALTMEQIKKVVTYKGSKTVEKYRDFWFSPICATESISGICFSCGMGTSWTVKSVLYAPRHRTRPTIYGK